MTVPHATTLLEYCLVTGLDWLDLMLVLRPGMLEALCDRLTESFNRQTPAIQQYYYVQYLSIKTSLYRYEEQFIMKKTIRNNINNKQRYLKC